MPNKYNHWLGKLFGAFNRSSYYAVTLGQTTYYSCDKSYVDKDSVWMKHEDVHKEQFKKDGWIKFLTRYIWQLITKGYKNIDYEIEAVKKSQEEV